MIQMQVVLPAFVLLQPFEEIFVHSQSPVIGCVVKPITRSLAYWCQ